MKKWLFLLSISFFSAGAMIQENFSEESSEKTLSDEDFEVVGDGFDLFYEEIFQVNPTIKYPRVSNLGVDVWDKNTISIKEVVGDSTMYRPTITLDNLLEIITEAVEVLKFRNKLVQESDYLTKSVNYVSKWIYGRPFNPFKIAKLFQKDETIQFLGSPHSSVHDLLFLLKRNDVVFEEASWKLSDTSKYFVVTGPIGKGLYGIETLYAILKMYLANPDNIFVVQGFNEKGTLLQEIIDRYEDVNQEEVAGVLERLYAYLPVAFFAGFEKNDGMHHWYMMSHAGVQSNDTNIAQLCNAALVSEDGISYENVLGFSGDSTDYQNITKNISNLPVINDKNHLLKGALCGGRHERMDEHGIEQQWSYGFYSMPGMVFMASSPHSLFGLAHYNYPGIIHYTLCELHADALYIKQLQNNIILNEKKTVYAKISLNLNNEYIVPLHVDQTRKIAQVSLDGNSIIPEFTVQKTLFRKEQDENRIASDIKAMNLKKPFNISEDELLKNIEEKMQEDELKDITDIEKNVVKNIASTTKEDPIDITQIQDDTIFIEEITEDEISISGIEKAEQELETEDFQAYQSLSQNTEIPWENVIQKQQKKTNLWNFLMSIKPKQATMSEWIATVNDSYFWTFFDKNVSDVDSWRIYARVRWRDYKARTK